MRVLVFGNFRSGESPFARQLSALRSIEVLDLNHVVWSWTEHWTEHLA
jgi:hypothetical protein